MKVVNVFVLTEAALGASPNISVFQGSSGEKRRKLFESTGSWAVEREHGT
jgi:hypothetical protein